MSRIGRQPITVPANVTVTVDGQHVAVQGPKGELALDVAHPITVAHRDGTVEVSRPNDERAAKALHGTSRTLVANMITGVNAGYQKKLELVGTGYRAQMVGKDLELHVGFSHPVRVPAPEGITFRVLKPTQFEVDGIDKQLVGQTAANIRKIRKPEPYKGKGIRYEDEQVRRKAGKSGK